MLKGRKKKEEKLYTEDALVEYAKENADYPEGAGFDQELVERHLAARGLWAVRREEHFTLEPCGM